VKVVNIKSTSNLVNWIVCFYLRCVCTDSLLHARERVELVQWTRWTLKLSWQSSVHSLDSLSLSEHIASRVNSTGLLGNSNSGVFV
jgi:hypothetical protein